MYKYFSRNESFGRVIEYGLKLLLATMENVLTVYIERD